MPATLPAAAVSTVEIGGVYLLITSSRGDRLEGSRTADGITFTGGPFGHHTITADSSDERVLAHWSGYVRNAARAIHGV
jgi:hypothetical protein